MAWARAWARAWTWAWAWAWAWTAIVDTSMYILLPRTIKTYILRKIVGLVIDRIVG